MIGLILAGLVFVGANLNYLGGKGGFHGARFLYRTLLLGLTLATTAYLVTGSWLASLLVLGLNLGFAWMPITFFGDDIHEHWFNIPWLYILGFIDGLKSIPVAFPNNLWMGLAFCAVYGIFFATIMRANIQKRGLCERMYGGARVILTMLIAV